MNAQEEVVGRVLEARDIPQLPKRQHEKRRLGKKSLAFILGNALVISLLSALPAQAAPCDPPITNPIACENTKPGNPQSEWDVSGGGSSNIEGFATDISVDQGQTVQFKIDTNSSNYRIDIYRLGYYGGMGARKIATVEPSAALPQNQPNCLTNSTTGLVDCGNWGVSASWAVPSDAVSGLYLGKLVREDGTSGSNHIPFVVRDDDGHSDLLFQTSDTTWQAYNEYGGNSLYTGNPDGRAYKVSYNRPFITRSCCAEDWLFNAEYPMIRFLERNGYNLSYFTGVDTARRGAELLEHKVFLSVGHDEYWAGVQRANVEAARAAGVNLAFFSGNEVFWKTRWEASIDRSNTSFRTLVTYKETHADAKIDPSPEWTGTWRDPRFSPPADGGRPENALTGTIFTVNDPGTFAMQVPAEDGRMRFWRNTSLATLPLGQVAVLSDETLGYEWDEDLDNGSRPAGLINLSTATYGVPSKLQDYGSTYASGTATHHLTLYKAASGALVFGAGSVQWSWGLDGNHDRGRFHAGCSHAAGHGESARRYAFATGDVAERPRCCHRVHGHDCTVGDDRVSRLTVRTSRSARRSRSRVPPRMLAGESSAVSKSPSTEARHGIRRRGGRTGASPGSPRLRARSRSGPARRTTVAISALRVRV